MVIPLNKNPKVFARIALVEALEARILFSADGFAVGVDAVSSGDLNVDDLTVGSILDKALRGDIQNDYNESHALPELKSQATAINGVVELIVIDSAVEDLEALLDQIKVKPDTTFEFLILDSDKNGIEQVDQYLNNLDRVTAIHIVSHGADGVVALGNTELSAETLLANELLLEGWNDSLAANADILFYGCDLASSADGQRFVDSLAEILDGDIAASENTTGHISLGGDWTLEYETGAIESTLFLSDDGVQSWQATLDIETGLIAHWAFDGDVLDSAGSNDGISNPQGYDPDGAPGFGTAADFGGDGAANAYVEIPHSAAMDFGTGDFSIAFWYNTSVVGATQESLLVNTDSISIYSQNTDQLVVKVGGAGANGAITTADNEYKHDGNWHHVSVVREAGELLIYSEGSVVASNANANKDVNSGNPYKMGAASAGNNDYEGSLDDVRIYSRALTAADVSELMTGAPNEAPVLNPFPSPLDVTSPSTEVEITFAQLSGSATDTDGSVVGMNVVQAYNGTLKIGPDSASATDFVQGSHETIDANNSAFWTPDATALGVTSAFDAVAFDDDLDESVESHTVSISVQNAVPTLTSFVSPVDSDQLNAEVELTFNELLASGDESDSDGTVDAFLVDSVPSGVLRIGVDSASAAVYVANGNDIIDASNSAYWTPDTDASGVLDAVALRAVDNEDDQSATPVIATVDINQPPALGGFASPVETTTVFTERAITLSDLIGNSDATDSDGTVTEFKVVSVLNGTLNIGPTANTATPFASASNDTVNATNKAYWTSSNNDLGVIDAFEVIAIDNDSASSASSVAAAIDVVNTAPTLSAFSVLTGAEDTETEFTYSDLIAAGDESDIDGTIESFVVDGVISGSLTIGSTSANATPYQSGTNDVVDSNNNAYWTPNTNANGQLGAFSLSAVDDLGAMSTTVVDLSVDVTPVSDPPESEDRVIDITADTSHVFTLNEFAFEDPIDGDAFATVRIDTLPSNGQLELIGTGVVAAGDVILITDIGNGKLVYTPALGAIPSATYDNFTFSVGDNSTVGQKYDLTPNEITVSVRNGIVDLAGGVELNIDGGNDAYLISDGPLGFVATELTWEMKFAVEAPPKEIMLSSYANTSYDGGSSNELLFAMQENNNLKIFLGDDLISASGIDYRAALFDGKLHTLSFTWNSVKGNWGVYIDGELVEEGNQFAGRKPNLTGGKLVFGQDQDSVGGGFASHQIFPGIMYDVRVWDRALQPSEINAYYQQKIDPDNLPDHLVANWQMDAFDVNNQIVDVVSGNNLSIGHASGAGFIPSEVSLIDMNVDENSEKGTQVGYVVPVEEVGTLNLIDDPRFTEHGKSRGTEHTNQTGSLGAWTIESGNIDLITRSTTFPSPVGGDTIDLSGNVPGAISQTINTIPGVEYELKFSLSGNGRSGDDLKSVRVTADTESRTVDYLVDKRGTWNSEDPNYWTVKNPLWSTEGFRFVASSSSSIIRFESLENNNRGPLLSHVEVRAVPPAIDTILGQNPELTYDPATRKFYQVVNQLVDHPTASAAASAAVINGVPGQLMILDTQHADNFLGDLVQSTGENFWAGASDAASEGAWVWNDGVQFWQGDKSGSPILGSYTNWSSSEPNNVGNVGEDYLERWSTSWNDVPGHVNNFYVIEWDAESVTGQYHFELTDDANGRFTIDASTGEITVADLSLLNNGAALDYETDVYHDIDVTVSDVTGHSYTETVRIDVNDINEPPSGIDQSVVINEDSVYQFSAVDFPLAPDPESDVLSGVVINTLPSAGTLKIGLQNVNQGQTLTLNQINSLSYTPAANDNGVDDFTFSVIDDGGTDKAGIDTALDPNTFTLNVLASNDAPVGTTGSIYSLEDQAHTFTSSDFGFTDPVENDDFVSVIVGAVGGSGAITLNGSIVQSNQEILVSDIDNGLLKFTPLANDHGVGYVTITFQVRDNGGTANGGVDTDQSANTLTINVASVNDAPSGADGVVSLFEDDTAIVTAADFGFMDSIDNDALFSVYIDSLPSNGLLELNGNALSVGQQVSAIDLASNMLTYTPNNNLNGVSLDQIQFRVRDDGGTIDGGIDTDAIANTLQFNVTPVNDEPAINDRTIVIDEDQIHQFALSNFNIIDVENHSLLDITIASLPIQGTLALNGSPVAMGDVIPSADLNNLTFTPAANVYGVSLTSFDIVVRDNGGVSNNGVDKDSTANSITFTVNGVNDAPTAAGFTSTIDEDGTHDYQLSDFGFVDIESDAFSELLITSLPSNGVLVLNGTPVVAGQVIPQLEVAQLSYTPPSDDSGVGYDSFGFKVKDNGGVVNGGFDTSGEYNALIDIVPVNDPPTSSGFTVSANEDTAYSFSPSQFVVVDKENHALEAIIISSLPASGTLSLAGSVVAAGDVIPVNSISSLVYMPSLHVNGLAADQFTFQVVDDGGVVNGGTDTDINQNTVQIDIASVNDEPNGTDDVITIVEDTSHTFSAVDFGFSDVDNNLFQSVIIQTPPVNGTLTLSGVPVFAGQVIDATQIGSLVFAPQPGANQAAYDSLAFLVTDDGGTLNGGVDTDTLARNIIINVGSMNDAPTGANVVAGTLEDNPYSFSDADFGFIDSDNNNFSHVIVDSLPVNGVLELSGVPLTIGQTVPFNSISNIQYTPNLHAAGVGLDSFDFRVVDDGGTANGGVDTSLQSNTWSIDVLSVNDAPVAVSKTVTLAEDSLHNFVAGNFGFSDIDNNALDAVIIQTLPVNGQLELNGGAVAIGQSISVSEIPGLSYVPALNGNGPGFDEFQFTVQDNGGTSNGGIDASASAAALNFNVLAVNDAPISSDSSISVLEDTPYRFNTGNFQYTDIEDHVLKSVIITVLPSQGQLALDGVSVVAAQVINKSDLSKLVYTPPANDNGIGYTSFAYRVQDEGGVINNGQDTSSIDNVITIDLLSVNDAPQAINTIVTTNEDTPYLFDLSDIGFVDVESDALASVQIVALPTNGLLSLAGVPVAVNQVVDSIDIGLLEYMPESHANGVALDSIEFVIRDAGGVSNGGEDTAAAFSRVQVNVVSVNDPPTGEDNLIALLEDTSYLLKPQDFGFSDVRDNDQFSGVVISQLPSSGVLSSGSVPVAEQQFVTAAEISTGSLIFSSPVVFDPAVGIGEIGFRVVDDGGTLRSGLDTDQQDRFIEFVIAEINDAPTLTLKDVAFDEGSDNVLDTALINAFDVDDNPEELTLTIQSSPENGALLLNGTEISEGATFTAAQLINNELFYVHNGSETTTDTFILSLTDGGEDGTQPVVGEFNITVNEVIDPRPELVDDNVTVAFGQSVDNVSFLENDTLLSDSHSIEIVDSPANGSVELNDDGTFSYVHHGGQFLNDSFTYRVTNSDNLSEIATVLINVEPALAPAFSAPVVAVEEIAEPIVDEQEPEVEEAVEVVDEPTQEMAETTLEFEAPAAESEFEAESQLASVVNYAQETDDVSLVVQLPEDDLDTLEVKQHNRLEVIALNSESGSKSKNILVDLEVKILDYRDITENDSFLDALNRLDDELSSSESENSTNYEIGGEAVFGVSLSATAGILAWALRGGALFASMMAATPIWSSIDPVRVMSSGKLEDDEPTDEVEKVFE